MTAQSFAGKQEVLMIPSFQKQAHPMLSNLRAAGDAVANLSSAQAEEQSGQVVGKAGLRDKLWEGRDYD